MSPLADQEAYTNSTSTEKEEGNGGESEKYNITMTKGKGRKKKKKIENLGNELKERDVENGNTYLWRQ